MPTRRTVRNAVCAVFGLALLATAACLPQEPTAERFAVLLHVQTPGGEPVAFARAWADGRALGATSQRGMLRAELRGRQGGAVELALVCPPAYRAEPASRTLVLRRLHGDERGTLELHAQCVPLEVTSALIVLASGRNVAGLPVRVDGETIGQTASDGSAHLLVTARATTTVRVEIDSSARPELLPRSPVHTFRLQDDDRILFVEQSFTPARLVRRPPRVAPPAPPPARPRRID